VRAHARKPGSEREGGNASRRPSREKLKLKTLRAAAPEALFNIGETQEGWTTVRRFVRALENSGLKSLRERPIRIGETGPDAYTID
jgi:hypothetical protein